MKTDTPTPKHERLQKLRGRLSDIRFEMESMILDDDGLWKGDLNPCVGGATCLIIAMHSAIEEMKKHHEKYGS